MSRQVKYIERQMSVRFSTNQVDVRSLLDDLSNAAALNAQHEAIGSPQQKTQEAISAILRKASNDINAANRNHWDGVS